MDLEVLIKEKDCIR